MQQLDGGARGASSSIVEVLWFQLCIESVAGTVGTEETTQNTVLPTRNTGSQRIRI